MFWQNHNQIVSHHMLSLHHRPLQSPFNSIFLTSAEHETTFHTSFPRSVSYISSSILICIIYSKQVSSIFLFLTGAVKLSDQFLFKTPVSPAIFTFIHCRKIKTSYLNHERGTRILFRRHRMSNVGQFNQQIGNISNLHFSQRTCTRCIKQ